jgi:Purple acid Phosphatase, N-terminal domain
MNQLLIKLATTAAVFGFAIPAVPQIAPSTPKAARVRIIQGPEIESARDFLTIIRWTTDNPGGSPVHYGVVHYGTRPRSLNQTAKSPIRLNPSHSSTVFRVRMEGLKTGVTYFYTVESEEANGTSDGVKSSVKQFAIEPQPGSASPRSPGR